ncbi:MAG TPA: VCBS repeat-containing protein [Bryobacteraceae bacterium]
MINIGANIVLAQTSLFTLGGTFPVGPGSYTTVTAVEMATADFNRDGKLDIVTLNAGDGTLTVLLGDGAGHFAQAPGSPIKVMTGTPPLATYSNAIATGDFNGDGFPDVAALGYDLAVLLGDGTGRFTNGKGFVQPNFHVSGTLLIAGDFTGDGKLDLVTAGFGGNPYLWPGDGSGGFGPFASLPFFSNYVTDIVAGDFNGDGKLDLAVQMSNGSTPSVYLGNGLGGFQHGISPLPTVFVETAPAAVGDFNGDGKSDVLTVSYFGNNFRSETWPGSSNLVFPWIAVTSPAPGYPLFPITGDFNGDGKLDWAGTYNGGIVAVELGDGTGAFTPAPGSPYVVGDSPYGIVAGDFNGDGKIDLAVDTGNQVVLLLNGITAGGLKTQVIQFTNPGGRTWTATPFTISATATSGLPVSFQSATPSVCTISGNSVALVGVGTCSITATQPGNSTYSAATPDTQSFVVSQALQTIAISIPPLAISSFWGVLRCP